MTRSFPRSGAILSHDNVLSHFQDPLDDLATPAQLLIADSINSIVTFCFFGIFCAFRPNLNYPHPRFPPSSANGFFVPRNCNRIGVPGRSNVSRMLFTRYRE